MTTGTQPSATSPASFRLDRATRIMLASAAVWALGLVVAAVTAPFYSGESTSGTTSITSGGTPTTVTTATHSTLVQVNGFKVLIPVAVPCLAVALVAAGLARRRRAHKTGPGPMASTVVVLLGVGTLAAILSIGILIVPVDALLVASCIRASKPPSLSIGAGTDIT